MEEDEVETIGDPKFVSDEPGPMDMAPRADLIGDLARRLCGDPPDYTAGPMLVEEIRAREGDALADDIARRLITAFRQAPNNPAVLDDADFRDNVLRSMRRAVRRVCAPYLYDLVSACTAAARFVEWASVPVVPPEQGLAAVSVLMVPLAANYGPGDRVRLPGGGRGIVVQRAGPDGRGGVMPVENDVPPGMDAQASPIGYSDDL